MENFIIELVNNNKELLIHYAALILTMFLVKMLFNYILKQCKKAVKSIAKGIYHYAAIHFFGGF